MTLLDRRVVQTTSVPCLPPFAQRRPLEKAHELEQPKHAKHLERDEAGQDGDARVTVQWKKDYGE